MNSNRRNADDIQPESWETAWTSTETATKQFQQAVVDLRNWDNGYRHASFDPFAALVGRCNGFGTFVDIGCGAGYYSHVLHRVRSPMVYHGCDFSAEMIQVAKESGWVGTFTVENAESLSFVENQFDVALLGGIIGHTPDWRKAISEAVRVARKYLILHRVGCCEDSVDGVRLSIKEAYGHEIPEAYFDQATVLAAVPGVMVGEPICWGHGPDGWMMSALFKLNKV